MTRKPGIWIAGAALCLTVAGCFGQAPHPVPSPSAVSSPTPGCTPDLVLAQVRRLLAGEDFEAHYLTIGDKLTLSVWLVDPGIDAATPPSGLAAAGRQAVARGLSVSYEVIERTPCAWRVFEQINPMIVDSRFQHWYKDFLPVGAFVGLRDPTTDELIAAIEATGAALQKPRSTSPPTASTVLPGSCAWSQAHEAIRTYLGPEENTAAYLIVGAGLVARDDGTAPLDDAGVEVQWRADGTTGTSDWVIRARLGHIADALACLQPEVDSLEAFVVDAAGRTLVYAVMAGWSARTPGATPAPRTVRIYHL